MPEPIVILSEESLRPDLRGLVGRTVEEMLNGLLDESESEFEFAPIPFTSLRRRHRRGTSHRPRRGGGLATASSTTGSSKRRAASSMGTMAEAPSAGSSKAARWLFRTVFRLM